jgi:sialate O-acetylesterase
MAIIIPHFAFMSLLTSTATGFYDSSSQPPEWRVKVAAMRRKFRVEYSRGKQHVASLAVTGVILLVCASAHAELWLPKVFGSNMLVQRGQPVRVWGKCDPNGTVQVSFGPRQATAHARVDGSWQVSLDPLPAGGPYTVTVRAGGDAVTLTNILCGDLWLCSGQSNMQMPVKDVSPTEQKAALVERPTVRLGSVAKSSSAKPLESAEIQWRVYTPESAREFSAVACFFAGELRNDPALADVPIGVVDSSFGGTTCEGWLPGPALTAFKANDLHDSMFGIKPANLYNAMIAPLGETKFKGVVWYQGESNSGHPETYPALLGTMISEWRKQLGQPRLPFFIVQLPDYANLWEGYYWPWIREMQAKAVQSIPDTALVVALGTTDGFNLHPKEKQEIGRRAALLARRVAYGEDIVALGPVFKSASAEGRALRVTFDSGGDVLASTAVDGVRGFAVAGVDGEYHFAEGRIEGDSVVVRSEEVSQPQTVRYAWAAMPEATLINRAGLPAAPFRTDALPCSNVEIQRKQVTHRVATSAYEIVIDANGMPTSLLIHGLQFLSNEAGVAGGGSIPGFWGPRTLNQIREAGPRLMTCSDDEVTLRITFNEASMRWMIHNHGKEPINFQLALSPHVKVLDSGSEGSVTVARGTNQMTLTGFDTITNTPTGPWLIGLVKGGGMKSISLK